MLHGMQLSIRGYHEKLPILLETLLQTFAQLESKITEARFASILDDYKRYLEGMEVSYSGPVTSLPSLERLC